MTDLENINKELLSTIARLTTLAANMPREVKTVSRHDFTGYALEAIEESLKLFSQVEVLPGPLNIMNKALQGAYRTKTGKDWRPWDQRPATLRESRSQSTSKAAASGALLRNLSLRNRADGSNPIRDDS